MRDFFLAQYDYIVFLYGVSLIVLSSLCIGRVSQKRAHKIIYTILGCFFLFAGIGEWLRVFACDLGDSIEFQIIRTIFFLISYFFLFSFLRRIFHILFFKVIPKVFYVFLVLFYGLSWILYGYDGVIAGLHYVFALVIGGLCAIFFYYYIQKENSFFLKIFSIFLGLYFLLRGIIVPSSKFLFSAKLNEESFKYFFGFPVEVVLCILIFICAYLLYRGFLEFEPSLDDKRSIYLKNGSRLIFIIVLVLGWFAVNSFEAYHKKEEQSIAYLSLHNLSYHLKDALIRTEEVAKSLSVSKRVKDVLKYSNELAIKRVNHLLDEYKELFDIDACYIVNKKGLIIAASEREGGNSYLKKTFINQPYFKEAIEKGKGYYFLRDLVEDIRIFYVSLAIKDEKDSIIGVVVVEKNLEGFVSHFEGFYHSFFISPEGIVLISGDKQFLFRSFYPISETLKEKIVLSRQFGEVDFTPLLAKHYLSSEKVFFNQKPYYLIKQSVGYGGWYLVSLWPVRGVLISRMIVIVIVMFVVSLIIVFTVIIRQQRRMFREIREAYEERKALFDAASAVAIITADLEGRIKVFNKGAEYILGYSAYEIRGRSICMFFSPKEERGEIKESPQFPRFCSLVEHARSGLLEEKEYVWYRKDGKRIVVSVSTACQRDDKGEIYGFVFMAIDITKRKKIEEKLRSEKDKAKMYFDIAGTILMVLDKEGKVFLINKKGCEVLGYKEEEIIGKDWFDNFLSPEIKEEVKNVFNHLLKGEIEKFSYYENPVLTKEGERIIAWHNTVICDEKGEIIGTLSSGEDITELKKTEKKLKGKINELETYHRFVVGRELKMRQLKEEIRHLRELLEKHNSQ